jgi:hypothetical protein
VSGAGSFGAGLGPAGSSPVPAPTPREVLTPGTAADYDPFAGVYPYDTSGVVQTTHPVWQRCALILGIRRGALRSSPLVGIPLDRLKNCTEATAQREAENAVRVALKDLLDAKDILVTAVTIETPWLGKFYTDIRNLREETADPTRFAVSVA